MSNACYKIPGENISKLARFNRKANKLNQNHLYVDIVNECIEDGYMYKWVQVRAKREIDK